MNWLTVFGIFLLAVFGGVLLEAVLLRAYRVVTGNHLKQHHFTISKYLFWLFVPLVGTTFVAYVAGWSIVAVFIAYALVGTLLEWFIGWSYEQVIGKRLWTYHTCAIGSRYTSLLSIPIWGLGGVLFWLLAKIFT